MSSAGSLIVVLVRVYYAARIFFDVEITQIYARFHGRSLAPEEHADKTPDAKGEQEQHQQGRSAGR